MLAAFVLFLREGFEASLIVSILLAALHQIGRTDQIRAVWTGVFAALGVSLLGGIVLYTTIRQYDGSTFQTIFETFAYLVAVVLLTGMTFWMQQHSKTLKKEIVAKAAAASSGAAFGLLAFTTVGREAIETMVFTLAFAFHTNGLLLLTGALGGLMTSLGLSYAIYHFGYKLNFRVFFRVMGITLLVFAAGLLGDAIQNSQQLGWLPIGSHVIWDTSAFLSENSSLGDILHTFLGYAQQPTVLQISLYALYLIIAGAIFMRMTRKPATDTSLAHPNMQ